MLTARSDGFKCKPFVILSRTRPVKHIVDKFGSKIHLIWAGSGNKSWFNDAHTATYLDKVIGNINFGKKLLIWDSFRCHISDATKKELQKRGIDTAVIPGGCTKFIQAPDVCWNKPFKGKIREYYNDWMLSGQKTLTRGGNPAAPQMEIYLKWIIDSWEALRKEKIIESFKICGITNALDGSEDDLIHCFKENGAVPNGRIILRNARQEQRDIIDVVVEPEADDDIGTLSDVSID